jgi:hypothetical protein
MNRYVVVVIAILSLLFASVPALAVNHTARIRFPIPQDVAMPVSMQGNLMSLDGKIWSGTGGLGGGQHIHYDFKLTNNSKATAFYSINVAFFDKDWKLIAANGFTQIFGKDPGATDGHSGDLYLPQSELSRIAIYQVTFYDDAAGIGKN